MPEFNLSFLVIALAMVAYLLMQFNQDMVLPQWLAPLSLGGLLAVLVGLLPWIGKGSFLAFVMGYLLLGVLLINWLVLFTMAYLPGQPVLQLSSRSARAGLMLLRLMGTGLVVLLKGVLHSLAWGMLQMMTVVLCAWNSYQKTNDRLPQKLLQSALAWE